MNQALLYAVCCEVPDKCKRYHLFLEPRSSPGHLYVKHDR